MTVIIQNVTIDPRKYKYIDRYIVSVFETPYIVDEKIKIYHFDTGILHSPYDLNVKINDIDRMVRVPFRIGQTMGELFSKLPRLVDEIPKEELLEYYKFKYGTRGAIVPMDSVVAAQTWVNLVDD